MTIYELRLPILIYLILGNVNVFWHKNPKNALLLPENIEKF